MTLGRLHVHLHELKEQLKEKHPVPGDLSNYIRFIVRAYVEDRYMILSEEILEVIDKGDFEAAVELMLPGLQKLREERMQEGQKKVAAKKASAAKKGRRKGGVKKKEDKMVESMYSNLMEGFK
jgi:hypothetical protein